MLDTIVGGFALPPMKGRDLPEEVATGFSEAVKSMVGAKYKPVLYVGKQVVRGQHRANRVRPNGGPYQAQQPPSVRAGFAQPSQLGAPEHVAVAPANHSILLN